jgi:hypothetical protein
VWLQAPLAPVARAVKSAKTARPAMPHAVRATARRRGSPHWRSLHEHGLGGLLAWLGGLCLVKPPHWWDIRPGCLRMVGVCATSVAMHVVTHPSWRPHSTRCCRVPAFKYGFSSGYVLLEETRSALFMVCKVGNDVISDTSRTTVPLKRMSSSSCTCFKHHTEDY